MKPNTKIVLTILLSLTFSTLSAQSILSLRLKRSYSYDQLDKIIDAIGSDLNIRFIYDKNHLSRYQTSFNPFISTGSNNSKDSTIGAILKTLRDAWDMETYIGKDGYVYIAENKNALEQLRNLKVTNDQQKIIEIQTERDALTPIKTNFTLSGDIFDIENGERIPYATVSIYGTTTGTTTDANGHFTLNNVPADTCTIQIRYIGYQTKLVPMTPSVDNLPLQINIEIQSQDIATVFIIGRKDDKALQQYTGEHKMKMAPEALKLLPNIGEKDILRGFQLMPGVSASNEGTSGMYVRGGTPDQNLILYDGFTVYYVDHLYGFYSAFNSNAIKDVQLYKGGFEAKYGGRLSSVTEITAKDGNKNKFTIGGEVSLLSVNAYTEIPIGSKVTTLFAFRRSYQGYMWNKISGQSKVQDGQTAVSRPSMRKMNSSSSPAYFYDINGKITITPTSKDIISLSVFNGTDYIDNTPQFSFGGGPGGGGGGITMDNADLAKYGNLGISTRWIRKLNDKWSMSLLGSFSNFYAKRDQTRSITVTRTNDDDETETEEINSGTLEDNKLYDYSLKNDWRYQFNENHSIEFGAFGTKYDIKYTYTQNEDEKLLDKQNNAILAGMYVQDRLTLANNRLVVTPGLRLNYFTSTKKPYLEPRVSGSYRLTNNLTVNAATGIFYQFANRIVREDVMSGNTDFWILSDGTEIPVSRSAHFNIGFNYDLPDYIFGVEAYYKRNHNISEYTLRYKQNGAAMGGPNSNSNTEISENFYIGNGYATGIEFLAQKKAGKFNGWISYSIGQVKNRFPEQSNKYYFAAQDVTHELKMVGIYRLGNFDVSATWIYATGKPYTAPLGAYQISSAGGVTETYYAVSDKNTFRLPNYHRLDLSASYRFNIFGTKGRQNAINFSLFNAYNRKNVSAKQFQIVDNTILESNINYLSITPNVTLVFKF